MNSGVAKELKASSHGRLDELKRALAIEVTRRFGVTEIRSKILQNLERWQAQGSWCTAYDDWKGIAESGRDDLLLAAMCGTDDEANRLRQSPPFVGLLPKELVRSFKRRILPSETETGPVLARKTLRAARHWDLTDDELASVLHLDASGRAALSQQVLELETGSLKFERATQFVRAWMATMSLMGGDANQARQWLRQPQREMSDQLPIAVMARPSDLDALANFLESRLDQYAAIDFEGEASSEALPGARWIRHRAISAFGSVDAAAEWLASSQLTLGGKVPQELIETEAGIREVHRAIDSINHG